MLEARKLSPSQQLVLSTHARKNPAPKLTSQLNNQPSKHPYIALLGAASVDDSRKMHLRPQVSDLRSQARKNIKHKHKKT